MDYKPKYNGKKYAERYWCTGYIAISAMSFLRSASSTIQSLGFVAIIAIYWVINWYTHQLENNDLRCTQKKVYTVGYKAGWNAAVNKMDADIARRNGRKMTK